MLCVCIVAKKLIQNCKKMTTNNLIYDYCRGIVIHQPIVNPYIFAMGESPITDMLRKVKNGLTKIGSRIKWRPRNSEYEYTFLKVFLFIKSWIFEYIIILPSCVNNNNITLPTLCKNKHIKSEKVSGTIFSLCAFMNSVQRLTFWANFSSWVAFTWRNFPQFLQTMWSIIGYLPKL